MQDEVQAEGPTRHEPGTATRNVEEATCTVEEQAPPT